MVCGGGRHTQRLPSFGGWTGHASRSTELERGDNRNPPSKQLPMTVWLRSERQREREGGRVWVCVRKRDGERETAIVSCLGIV